MNPKPVRKAIIAAAGYGTRFLPQTKAMPKEMLPVIDKPVIQLVVEEVVKAGVTDVIIVTGPTKRAIEDHFDRALELEEELREKGKHAVADTLQAIAEQANFIYLRQKGLPKGNARPVLNAAHLIGDEPFLVFYGDDFFTGEIPRAQQLVETYNQTGGSVISLIEIDKKDADKYGVVGVKEKLDDKVVKISQIVEKPGAEAAPSSFASVGGYLLTPDILPLIAEEQVGSNGELNLSETIGRLAQQTDVYGRFIDGEYHDTGNPELYLQAVIDVALKDAKLGPELREYLHRKLK
ncbi:MAG TPA: UTP--glucose-1-phosphate uridylyltransferase [Candidatus Saccharimonadales bacterium]|nr:UTP--glucose-1-phosphate uridylyltransferase [Candidatus Saccharimonadales bacterium]